MMSAFVLPVTNFPAMAAAKAAIHAPKGSPEEIVTLSAIFIAPPPIAPAVADANRASPFINAFFYDSLGKKCISKYLVKELL